MLSIHASRCLHHQQSVLWAVQVDNVPAIADNVLREVGDGMKRVHACFDHSLRTFLTLLPAQSHLDLRMFMARFDQPGADVETAAA